MTPHMVAVVDGRYQVYRSPDGRTREYIGPSWATPRPAIVYAKTLDGDSGVSPLRAPRSGPNDLARDHPGSQGHSTRIGAPDQSPPGLDRS